MSKIRLAVIGAGAIGRKHIAVIRANPRAELVALADPSPQAQALAQSLGMITLKPCWTRSSRRG
nr:Gfo/Idh/MocA family oxidoreductase [Raoultella ornithinolytica]